MRAICCVILSLVFGHIWVQICSSMHRKTPAENKLAAMMIILCFVFAATAVGLCIAGL